MHPICGISSLHPQPMVNKSLIVTLLALLTSLSLAAQSFTSTSAGLDGVSSVSSVSAVGASSAQQLATTTFDAGGNDVAGAVVCGNTMSADEFNFNGATANDAGFRDNSSPIGEPFILLAFAALMGGIIAFRRRRA